MSTRSHKHGSPSRKIARASRGPTGSSTALAGNRLAREIFAQTRTPAFRSYIKKLLIELCRIDTTPNPDIDRMGAAEDRCFRILERELGALGYAGAQLKRLPIASSIQTHPNYSLLHFTKTASNPSGLTPEEVYARRSNLVYVIPGSNARKAGSSIALNAHLDVVAPYLPPRARGEVVYGRGACDDKGPVVGILAALKVLSACLAKTGPAWNRNVVAMFVVEEETGGNGSLSLAVDRDLKQLYDSVLVSECTGLRIHPANRGAVWYRVEVRPPAGVSELEMFAFINEEMEKEGTAIRAESAHKLFPQRPVQTCHGIIGPFGEHPSRICAHMGVSILFDRQPDRLTEALLKDCLDAGLAGYLGLYGDKTAVIDPSTNRPMVARHFDLKRKNSGFELQVYGAAGHMGSIRERDGAITKAAHLIRGLVSSKAKLEKSAGKLRLKLSAQGASLQENKLILEGGQGFVPTHGIEEIMSRMRRGAERGAENYLRRIGRKEMGREVVAVAYEKLHNVAFDGDPASPTMHCALESARVCGLWKDEPVLGWAVSCDARLFATEYPGMPVLTFGPGQLVHAHSDHEQIAIDEIRAASEFIALFLLKQTGTIE